MDRFIGASRSRNMRVRVFLSAFAGALTTTAVLGTGDAQAALYGYHWDRPPGFDGTSEPIYVSDEAGFITSITAEYDSDTQQLTFLAAFEPEEGTGQLPVGFFLVVNNGPDPKGIDGEYAILYFDAISSANPVLTAYAYNGENGADSFFDGQLAVGNQTPDPIISSLNDPSFVIAANSVDGVGGRVLSFTIDAAALNAHSPMYGNDADWFGMGFDDTIGVWLHTYSYLHPAYGADGFLLPLANGTSWLHWSQYPDLGEQFHGWFDATPQQTNTDIPEPATLGLMALGLAVLNTRGRRTRR